MAYLAGVSTQKVSMGIAKPLDYELSLGEVGQVKARLNDLRLRMTAYYAATIPGDDSVRRKLFEFVRGLGADMIVCSPEPAALAALDKLANEFAINIALTNRDPKGALAPLEQLSPRVGSQRGSGRLDGEWNRAAHRPRAAERPCAGSEPAGPERAWPEGPQCRAGRGYRQSGGVYLQLSRLQPPHAPANYPLPYGRDGGSPRVEGKPLFFAWIRPVRATSG